MVENKKRYCVYCFHYSPYYPGGVCSHPQLSTARESLVHGIMYTYAPPNRESGCGPEGLMFEPRIRWVEVPLADVPPSWTFRGFINRIFRRLGL